VTVVLCVVLLAASAALGVASWHRSGGSMVRYRRYTGAPVVWLLLGASALAALLAGRTGDRDLLTGLLTGGLIGTGLVQVVLLRRTEIAAHERTAHDGAVQNGAVGDGAVQNGAVEDGAVRNGTLPDGGVRKGADG
jgi:hypothetical protein